MSSDQRPQNFTVMYHGQRILFERLTTGRGARELDVGDKIIGYGYRCPFDAERKQPLNWIDTESGTHQKLEFDEEGRATITGSLIHRSTGPGCKCGWHVVITKGIAEDV